MADASLDLSLPVASQPSLDALVGMGQRAEELGFDRVWLPESWGRDAVTVLALLAERTTEIGISNNVFTVYSRSPAIVAMTAVTIQEASEGRYRVGLGTSGPIVIENLHGMEWENPLRRLREYVEIVRQFYTGEEVEYDGEYFKLSGFRLRCDPPGTPPPIDLATIGPKAVELTGRFADGWQGLAYTREGIDTRLADLERGAGLGNRSVDDVRVMIGRTCMALEDGDRARDLARQHMAFYLGGMGTFYRDALAREGHEAVAHDIYDAWQDGDRERAVDLVDEHLLHEMPVGTPEEVRETLAEVREIDALDAVSVGFPRGASVEEIEATMAAVAPTE